MADDGPGIAPEHHDRIFQMFKTLAPKDETDSNGMGLAMIKKTVEHYGGAVRVDSNAGGGARFSFTWPKSISRQALVGGDSMETEFFVA